MEVVDVGIKVVDNDLSDFADTFTLISRFDTHYFLKRDLPEFLEKYKEIGIERFRRYFTSLRSGEYIPKKFYCNEKLSALFFCNPGKNCSPA